MTVRATWWLPILLVACADVDGLADRDGDGLVAANDCNDDDASVFPGADEVTADGIDQDCDGFETCFADADADGYRGEATAEDADLTCAAHATVAAGDCDDDDAARNPGVAEVCGVSDVDEDCDGLVDADDLAGCFDWAGTYTGEIEVFYGIDHSFGAICSGTATAVVDAAGAVAITGSCTLNDTFYAEDFGSQAITGAGASTGSYLASGTLQLDGMEGTWDADFRPGIFTVSLSGLGMTAGHSVQYEGKFLGNL